MSPHVKDTWHELPVVDGSTEAGSTEVSNWSVYAEKDSLPKVVQRGPIMLCLRTILVILLGICFLLESKCVLIDRIRSMRTSCLALPW